MDDKLRLFLAQQNLLMLLPDWGLQRLEEYITVHTKQAQLDLLNELEKEKQIYVKHEDVVTQLNEPPLVITTDYKYMIDLTALQAKRKELENG